MEVLVPVGVLVLAFLLGIVFFKQSLSERKIKIFKLVFVGTFIVVYLLILFVFKDAIEKDATLNKLFDYIYFGSYIVLGLAFALSTSASVTKNYIYSEYYKCIEQEKLFILIDRNDKIKELSTVFEKVLQTEDKSLNGEKFMDVFDNKFSLAEINEQDFNNNDLRKIFAELKNSTAPATYVRELKVYDRKTNKPFVIKFTDHVLVENNKYRGHILIGDSKTGDQVLNVEAELMKKEASLESIKLRFATHLEVTEEAIFFLKLDDLSIWGNDVFVETLHLSGNSITRKEYLDYIHKDDLDYYLATISSLTASNPRYDVKYRFKTGANYSYIREYGKRIASANSTEIMGYIDVLATNHYERSNIKELDDIKSSDELMVDINELYKLGRTFQLVTFRINNIPDINDQESRDIGNLVMSEYLKAIWRSFVEEGRIYRVSGLEFSFILTDYRKMDILLKALAKDTILHASMKYGTVEITTDVYMGIASSNEVRGATELYQASRKALKAALMDQIRTNYIYYKDIK